MKNYVEVTAVFDKEGVITRLLLKLMMKSLRLTELWIFVLLLRLNRAVQEFRYKCRIEGRETYLFLEETRWFWSLLSSNFV